MGLLLVLGGLVGLDEERRLGHQARAHGGAGALVVGEPAGELAGRERCFAQRREQGLGVGGVGARQRDEHPYRGPGGERARHQRGEQRLGERAQERQAPADPAHVAPERAGQGVLGEPALAGELAQQQRLLERLEGTGLGVGEE